MSTMKADATAEKRPAYLFISGIRRMLAGGGRTNIMVVLKSWYFW